ncbi:hypothetical protein BC830DRAFT_1135056 [Chytriomyces sp. MP71]|nr:hypothetical protein BC830DRAFT_1135056 [Chytriomyces sp. MP71]
MMPMMSAPAMLPPPPLILSSFASDKKTVFGYADAVGLAVATNNNTGSNLPNQANHINNAQTQSTSASNPNYPVFDFEPFVRTSLNFDLDPGRKGGGEGICKFFLKGFCAKGQLCPYKHVSQAAANASAHKAGVVCKHYLRGLCKKGDLCEFLHEYNLKKMPECWFYSKYGECSNPECQYLHLDPESKIKECPWYARGFCKHGPKCRNKHVRQAVCQNYVTGFCPKGSDCPFGHPKYELPNLNDDATPGVIPSGPGFGKKEVTCYKCQGKGHFAAECPQNNPSTSGATAGASAGGNVQAGAAAQGGYGGFKRDFSTVKCFKCQGFGHFANQCPQNGGVIPGQGRFFGGR